ncbi:MAG: PDZ domain-containing protein [Bacteroidota bacterium]
MNHILRVIAYSTIILITGCVTINPVNTLNGKADVIIPNASKSEIADKITNAMLSADFRLERRDQDDNMLVFMKRLERLATTWLFQYTYNIVNHPPEGIRVTAYISRIMNPGRKDQSVTDISRGSKESESVYVLLTGIRDNFSLRKSPKDRANIGMELKDYTILSVAQGGAAEKAGLQKGDVILKIDGEPTTGDQQKDALRITGKPSVKLLIKRNDQELVIHMVR